MDVPTVDEPTEDDSAEDDPTVEVSTLELPYSDSEALELVKVLGKAEDPVLREIVGYDPVLSEMVLLATEELVNV